MPIFCGNCKLITHYLIRTCSCNSKKKSVEEYLTTFIYFKNLLSTLFLFVSRFFLDWYCSKHFGIILIEQKYKCLLFLRGRKDLHNSNDRGSRNRFHGATFHAYVLCSKKKQHKQLYYIYIYEVIHKFLGHLYLCIAVA